MRRLYCQSCHGPIRSGDAVIRSRLFEIRAWHPACFEGQPAQ